MLAVWVIPIFSRSIYSPVVIAEFSNPKIRRILFVLLILFTGLIELN